MALRNLHSDGGIEDRAAQLREIVHEKLSLAPQDKFFTLLRKVAEYYPLIVDQYLPTKIFANYSFLSSVDQVTVLELLAMRAELANRVFPALHAQVVGTLRSMSDLQRVALYNLLLQLVPKLSSDFVRSTHSTFVSPAALTSLATTPDGRVAFYSLCIALHDNHEAALGKAAVDSLLHTIVAGVEDSSLFVRDLIVRFCDNEARLPADGLARFHKLLSAAHVEGAGKTWLQHSAVLMLALCHRNPDFSRTDIMFPPLTQCTFRQASIGTVQGPSSSLGSLTLGGGGVMTPMFSSQVPVSKLLHMPPSLGGFRRVENNDEEAAASDAPRSQIRMIASQSASVNRLFLPTQQGQFASFEASVRPSAVPSSLMFAPDASQGSGVPSEVRPLRRRFLATQEETLVKRHILHASRVRQERQVYDSREKTRLANSLVLFRSYREGEVPDVQISLQSLVVPLQALCLFDPETASMTMTLMGEGIVQKLCTLASSVPVVNTATIPRSVGAIVPSLFNDMAPSITAQSARTLRDDVRAALTTTMLRSSSFPGLIKFAHEMLLALVAANPSPLPPFEAIFGSCVAAGCVESALLLTERCLEALGKTPGAAASNTTRVGWVYYFMELRRNGEDGVAGMAAKSFVPMRDVFASYLAKTEQGDYDGAVKEVSSIIAALQQSGTAADLIVIEALEHEKRRALSLLMQWEPIVASFQNDPERALWCREKEHDVEMLINALTKTRQSAALLGAFDKFGGEVAGEYLLQRASLQFAQRDFASAKRLAQSSMMSGLARDGGVSNPSVLHAIFLAASLWETSSVLIAAPASTTQLVSGALLEVVDRFVANVELPAEASQWDDLLYTLDLIHGASTHALARNAEHQRSFSRHASQVSASVHARAGSSLCRFAASNAAAKVFLSRALAKKQEFDAELWAAVVQTTAWRLYFTSPPSTLRGLFGEVLKSIRTHGERVAAGTLSETCFARVEADFWPIFARALLKHEGITVQNSAEIVALTTKSITKMNLVRTQSCAEDLFSLCQAVLGASRGEAQLDDETADSFGGEMAKALLRSLEQFRSVRARASFPALLSLVHEERHQAARKELAARSGAVPTWMVLPWTAQLLSTLMHCPFGATVASLVTRLAVHHPQTVFYPYNCARDEIESLARSPSAAPEVILCLKSVSEIMEGGGLSSIRAFARHLHHLHNPELRLKQWLEEIRLELAAATGPLEIEKQLRAQRLVAMMQADCFDAAGCGPFNRNFIGQWAAQVMDGLAKHGGVLQYNADHFKKLFELMKQSIRYDSSVVPISSFSETLANLDLARDGSNCLDVPQQPFHYLRGDFPAPLPRVISFDKNVLIMASAQKPKRLTAYGTDGRAHQFLVKGGDDLRLDERIEQLFTAINTLASSGSSLPAFSSIRTYSVIPVTKHIGLVQWVGNTEQLKEVIEKQMHRECAPGTRDQLTVLSHPSTVHYRSFVDGLDVPNAAYKKLLERQPHLRYLFAFQSVSNKRCEHTQRVADWIGAIYPFYLRDGLEAICDDHSSFYKLRQRFCASLAGLSVASYVLGIGDRHLENFLVDKSTGQVVAIDFGHAFGSATTLLSIPELMPFRLSPQMVHVLGPLGTDMLAPHMSRTIKVMRDQKALLLSIASLFLSEPLHVWQKETTVWKPLSAVAREKVDTVRRKLDCENPVRILCDDVRRNGVVERYGMTQDVIRVAEGEPQKREVSQLRLRDEDFVDMLIDLATDVNIAGHTWVGWSPFF